jgi:hypothetical protein
VPSPVFVAAFCGVDKLLLIPLHANRPRSTYARQALQKLPDFVPAFGPPIGFVVNYSPDRAIRFDLEGRARELLPRAMRPGRAFMTVRLFAT